VDDMSRINTPDDSDEEDTGDYDNVVGLVGDEHTPASYKSRSRQSSYADLQRLRMAPLISQTRTENEDSHTRLPHRTRRASLSDGVAVTRIAAMDPEESFSAATQDLNDEISHAKTL